MSKIFTKATLALEERSLKHLEHDYFVCTAKQAPECTGRGFLVGRDKATCSPCLNWQKRDEAERLEKADYSFVMKD